MQFITEVNTIAVDNFNIGYSYNIRFTDDTLKTLVCIGKGIDFVMFQDKYPDLLWSLTMTTAATVSEIDVWSGGTTNYNDLSNKPQINSHTLFGNMSSSDLGLVSESELEDYVTETALETALGDYVTETSLETTLGDYVTETSLETTLGDYVTETALETALGDYVTDSDLTTALSSKQDTLTTAQQTAVDSGITSTLVGQISTNENNILILNKYAGGKNKYSVDATVTGNSHVDATKTSTGYQLSANGSWAHMDQEVILPSAGRYVISMTISNYNSVVSSYAPSIIICPTSSISAPYLGSVIIEDNGEIVLTVETTNPILYISYYINRSASESPTSSFEASDVMVSSESDWLTSHDYQPYALSNAELTAAIQAIQSQLANT